jgi:hypothetical protein
MPMIVMETLPSVRMRWPMKRVGTLACILFAVVGAPAGLAKRRLSVDWKFYGGASLDGHSECFYDAKGVVPGPDGHIRVWTNCLLQKDMDSIDIKKDFDGKILANTAQKVANQYVPPIATVETIDVNQRIVDAVTRVLAKELGPRKIRVNAIKPGAVETEGTHAAGVIGSDLEKQYIARTPLGRTGQPDDIAPVAVFLASDDSRWVTGDTLAVSGGIA